MKKKKKVNEPHCYICGSTEAICVDYVDAMYCRFYKKAAKKTKSFTKKKKKHD